VRKRKLRRGKKREGERERKKTERTAPTGKSRVTTALYWGIAQGYRSSTV